VLLEELKQLRQSNTQYKRDIREKDEIIKELQTRPAEPRSMVYQRTITEVPAYLPGNADTLQHSHEDLEDVVRAYSENSSPSKPSHQNVESHANLQANSDTLAHIEHSTNSDSVVGENVAPFWDQNRRPITSENASDQFNEMTFVSTTNGSPAKRYDDTALSGAGATDTKNVSVPEVHYSQVQTKSEAMTIQQPTENNQTDARTEKTPLSSPRAVYHDPQVPDLIAKLADKERQLSIKSDEVHRLSLKLAEFAERASSAPQTTIINQVVPSKKEVTFD